MSEVQATEAIVQAGAVGLLALTIVLGFRYLSTKNGQQTKNNSIAAAELGKAASSLSQLHEDMRDMLRENRESHAVMVTALVRLLERGDKS